MYNADMRGFFKKNRLTHWIAIFAILMSAVAPTISQALSSKTSSVDYTYVCTASGMKTVALSTDPSKDSQSDHKKVTGDHCGYCVFQGTYYVPTDSSTRFDPSKLASFYSEPYYQSPKPLFAWIKLPSQAPPSLI